MGLTSILPFLAQLKQTVPDASGVQAAGPSDPNAGTPPTMLQPPPPVPEQTKGHKLLQILQGGLTGAMSGMAQNAQTYAATGRNAGFGGGLGAGFLQTLPFQQQENQQRLAQQQAQTQLTQQQAQMVQTPYGLLPQSLAKMIFPASIAAGAKIGSAQIGATAKENVANTQAATQQAVHRYVPVNGVGLFDTHTRQVVPGSASGITITPEIAKDHNLPDEFIGKQMQLQQLSGLERVENQQNTVAMTAQGPIVVNKKSNVGTPVKGNAGQSFSPPALASPIVVGDVSSPGQTKVESAGQAISQGAPGPTSASVEVPKKAELSEVPKNIGDQKVAFTTMIQHADLLRRAAKALNNGDMQTLNGLENAFKNEFGYSGPITAQAISDAYGGEVTNVISKGHITDKEAEKTGKTLNPSKQNYATIDSVLGAYQALAQSKMNMLNKQQQSAIDKSQPNNSKSKNDPLSIR